MRQRPRVQTVALLDPLTIRGPAEVGVSHARIFGDFTEKILAIDGLKSASKQSAKVDAPHGELLLLPVGYPVEERLGGHTACGGEALRDPIKRAWPSYDELGLVEIEHGRVVEVDGILEGEERAQAGVAENALVNAFQIRQLLEPIWQTIRHHCCD